MKMNPSNKLLTITIIALLANLSAAQIPSDVPDMKGIPLKIVREEKGNVTTLHFINTDTNKEIFARDIPVEKNIKIKTTTTIRQNTIPIQINNPQTTPTPITTYIIIGIIAAAIIAIILWKLGQDKEGETK
jgi:hypothetical protein